jgi:uncharacterized membrane protein
VDDDENDDDDDEGEEENDGGDEGQRQKMSKQNEHKNMEINPHAKNGRLKAEQLMSKNKFSRKI